jgi:hypothetical protein
MLDGLYHAIVTQADDTTNCVMSIRDGLIEGGDSVSCFAGLVAFQGANFTAELIVRKYADLDHYLPMFGLQPVRVIIRGQITGNGTALGTATCNENPRVTATIQLQRLWLENFNHSEDEPRRLVDAA